jgi:hypothetical protein
VSLCLVLIVPLPYANNLLGWLVGWVLSEPSFLASFPPRGTTLVAATTHLILKGSPGGGCPSLPYAIPLPPIPREGPPPSFPVRDPRVRGGGGIGGE